MMERAHFHQRRLLEALDDLEHELGAVVPGVFSTTKDVLTIQRVEIDHVESAFVVKIGRPLGDISQQTGFRVGHEQSEAFLQMPRLCSARMGRRARPISATLTTGELERRRFGNFIVGD